MMETADKSNAGFWAIVELFGHQRIAGFLSEYTIGGQSFVRVDVPELPEKTGRYDADGPVAAHSKLYGGGAIYAISPVDEAIARTAAAQIRHKPVDSYGLRDAIRNMSQENRQRLLADNGSQDDSHGDDFDDTFPR